MSSKASDAVNELLRKADIPSVHTLMAAGVVSSDEEMNLGLIGMHGTVAANRAVDQADVIIALGARFSDRVALNTRTWGRRARIVQIDIDASEINKNVSIDKCCVGDVREILERALPYVDRARHYEWHDRVVSWKNKTAQKRTMDHGLDPHLILDKICGLCDEDTIFVTDVGQHQMWAAQYLKFRKPNKFLTSGGLGTMGFGYGAAIGAKVGCPQHRVIHLTGDGSFHMNLNEACTAVSQNLPIITVIFNNQVLGMVYQWQTIFYGGRYSSTVPERKTDYVKLAEGFGLKGYHVETLEEFEEAMKEAMKSEGPAWIECKIEKVERVLPMIPGGKTVEEIIVD